MTSWQDCSRGLGEEIVDLALPQYLEMGVRFVKQKNGSRIQCQVGEEQNRLLEPPSRRRQIKAYAFPGLERHCDLAAFRDVDRII